MRAPGPAKIRSRAGRLARDLLGAAALRLPPVAGKAAGTISGIGIDYPHAPRAHDIPLRDGGRLYEALRDGRFVLVAPAEAAPAIGAALDRVTPAVPADPATPWMLVRPDAHLAWQGEASTLRTALREQGVPV